MKWIEMDETHPNARLFFWAFGCLMCFVTSRFFFRPLSFEPKIRARDGFQVQAFPDECKGILPEVFRTRNFIEVMLKSGRIRSKGFL